MSVDAFENVNLTRVGPLRTEHPIRRPCTADTARHVCNVGNEQTTSEGLFRSHSNGLATFGRVLGLEVNTHENSTFGVSSEALLVGSLAIDIFDEALSGILVGEEVEAIEKVGVVVSGVDVVVCPGKPSGK